MTAVTTFRLAAWREWRRSRLLALVPTALVVVAACLQGRTAQESSPFLLSGLAGAVLLRAAGGASGPDRYWSGLTGPLGARLAGRWAIHAITAGLPLVAGAWLLAAHGWLDAVPDRELSDRLATVEFLFPLGVLLALVGWAAAVAGRALLGAVGAVVTSVLWMGGLAGTMSAAAEIAGWPGRSELAGRAGLLLALGVALAAWAERRGGAWRGGVDRRGVLALGAAPALLLGATLLVERTFPLPLGPAAPAAVGEDGRVARIRPFFPGIEWAGRVWIWQDGVERSLDIARPARVALGPAGSVAVLTYRPSPSFHAWEDEDVLVTAAGEQRRCPAWKWSRPTWRADGRQFVSGRQVVDLDHGCRDLPEGESAAWIGGHDVRLVEVARGAEPVAPWGVGAGEVALTVYDVRLDGISVAALAAPFEDWFEPGVVSLIQADRLTDGFDTFTISPDGLTLAPAGDGWDPLDATHEWGHGSVRGHTPPRVWVLPPEVIDLYNTPWAWNGDALRIATHAAILDVTPEGTKVVDYDMP